MQNFITQEQWNRYQEQGYLRLGQVLTDAGLLASQERIDAIMLGTAPTDTSRLLMQLDSPDGQYENAGVQSFGSKGATLAYRKIQELEYDPLFLEYLRHPVFEEICAHVYGAGTEIASFRAMFMNKPAHAGTLLPWHQDRWSDLDRDPLITIWTALDPATAANGCVEVIPGSHGRLINPDHPSGFLTPEQGEAAMKSHGTEFIELKPGEAVLLHNWLLHRSDVNRTDVSRRAFSASYMDARTQSRGGSRFNTVFGEKVLRLT